MDVSSLTLCRPSAAKSSAIRSRHPGALHVVIANTEPTRQKRWDIDNIQARRVPVAVLMAPIRLLSPGSRRFFLRSKNRAEAPAPTSGNAPTVALRSIKHRVLSRSLPRSSAFFRRLPQYASMLKYGAYFFNALFFSAAIGLRRGLGPVYRAALSAVSAPFNILPRPMRTHSGATPRAGPVSTESLPFQLYPVSKAFLRAEVVSTP